jgi:hypothetical protein
VSARLRLTYISFERVEFELSDSERTRPVVVRVGSERSWRRAVRFPTIGSDATETTGDERLDEAIRLRAAEELVPLAGRSAV